MCGKISPLQRHFSGGFLGILDEAVGFVLRKHASAEGRCDTREEEVCFPFLSWVVAPSKVCSRKQVYLLRFSLRTKQQRAWCLSLHGARHLPCFSSRNCGLATMLRDVIPFIVS